MLVVVVLVTRFEIVMIGLQLRLPLVAAAETAVVVADSYNILLADFDIVHLPLMCHRYIHHPFAVCSHLIVQNSMRNCLIVLAAPAAAAALRLESARRMECFEEMMMRIAFHRMISAVPTDADFFSVVLLMIPATCDLE